MADKHLSNQIFGNALNLIPQLGAVGLGRLWRYFGNFESAWFADGNSYLESGLSAKTVSQIIAGKSKINPEQSFAELARRQIQLLTLDNSFYPPLLKEIVAHPPLLYIRGNPKVLKSAGIGVVGTRKISHYGRQACQELVLGLIQNNLSIISGLAFGIDAEALNCCLREQGVPIAVLASDLDNTSISPRQNFNLAQDIIQAGCLVSEYPLGQTIQKQNFPIRNRIIAGLSLGTLIIEADQDSGSLITAKYALEQNREVFAVPGPIFSPVSRGTNHLIKQGAKLTASVQDILDELNITPQTPVEMLAAEVSPAEQRLLEILSREPQHIDELVRSLKQPAGQISAQLTMLEMKGRIKHLGNAKYAKLR